MVRLNFPLTDEAECQAYSAALFELLRPTSERGQSDVTAYYCPWEQVGGVWYLRLPIFDEAIHVNADNQALNVVLNRPTVPGSERSAIRSLINSQRGMTHTMLDFIPTSDQAASITDDAFYDLKRIDDPRLPPRISQLDVGRRRANGR